MEFKTLKNLQAYYNEMVEKANTATGTILPVNVLTTKNLVQNLTAQFEKEETVLEPATFEGSDKEVAKKAMLEVLEPKATQPQAPSAPPQVEDKKPGKKKRDFELVPSQRSEVDNLLNFINGKDFYRAGVLTKGTKGYDIYQLAGFAGVGKSTIIDVLLEEAGLSPYRVRMCAPTGTAALVLRDKTPDYDAITIHRLIYKWDIENGKKVRRVVSDNIKGTKLVIADESSMTTREEGENLIRMCKEAKVKLLIVGDPGQLPPVDPKAEKEGRRPDFFLLNPDGFLREVMRQAADNPIIKMSMDVRAATDRGVAYQFPMDVDKIGNNIFLRTKTQLQLPTIAKMLTGDGALIVGTNKTRKAFNNALRAFFGFDKPTLMDGEKILIKENCEDGEVTNGMRGTVSNVRMQSDGLIGFIFTPDKFEGSHYLTVHPDVLFERKTKKAMAYENFQRRDRGEKMIELGIEAFFGYAITCHASQGSQWKNVYVIDEGWAFNRGNEGYINQNRWTYTAVTRAAENLVIFRGGKLHIPTPEQAKAMAAQLGVKPLAPSSAPKKESVMVFDGDSHKKDIEVTSPVIVELIKKTELYCSTYTESRLKDGEASSSLKGHDIPELVKFGWELKGTMLMPGYRGEDDPYELDAYFTKTDGEHVYQLCFGYSNNSLMEKGWDDKSGYDASYGVSRYGADYDIIAALYKEDADIQEDDVFIPVSK